MAVDAGHLSLFPSQLIPNRGMMNAIEPRVAADYLYGAAAATPAPAMGYRVPVSGASATVDDTSSLLLYASMKAAAETSDLTYNHHLPPPPSAAVSRKRPRETQIPSVDPFVSSYASPMAPAKICSSVGSGLSFLGEDYSIQILQQQVEIDRFISQHVRSTADLNRPEKERSGFFSILMPFFSSSTSLARDRISLKQFWNLLPEREISCTMQQTSRKKPRMSQVHSHQSVSLNSKESRSSATP